MQQRLASLLERPLTFAHRGARAHAPENTIEAFRLALKLGATGLESDVWVTADGVAVLDHDGVVGTRGRRRAIGEVDRAALPSHIPSVAEMLEACPEEFAFSLDLKDDAAIGPTLGAIREVRPNLEGDLWLCHHDVHRLIAMRPLSDDVMWVDSTRLARLKEGAERRGAMLREHGIAAINMHHTDWTGGLTTLFHRFGLCALGWDLQYEHLLRNALRMGLDGIYSDHVDRMMDCYRMEIGTGP
jgi:glycerophosphoryl diester phosphodiesterase